MNDKIIFWVDLWFYHFSFAEYLKKQYPCEIYAIIDVDDKAKRFFEKQKFVDFKKKWYFLDSIQEKNKKPDVKYLKSIEEKYKINLWQIAYTERKFYQFNPFYSFNSEQILKILENECRFFENILEEINPDFFLTYLTVNHYHHLFYEMCKSIGIKVLMLMPTRFGNRSMISEDVNQVDYNGKIEYDGNTSNKDLKKYFQKYDSFDQIMKIKNSAFQSHKKDRYSAILKFFTSKRDASYYLRYSNYGKTRSSVLKEKITRNMRRRIRSSFINKNLGFDYKKYQPYIYFPMHYEPERTLLVDSPLYDDQITVIKNIAKSIPINFTLIVKEHPYMDTVGWRPIEDYKKILSLPNVKLIHPSISSKNLIQNCSLIITIAGTTGHEAAFYGKPAIAFTKQLYSDVSSVNTLERLNDLPNLIRDSLEKKVEKNSLENYVKKIDRNSFETHLYDIGTDFAYTFGLKGPMMDADMPLWKVEKFLEKYKLEFEKLAQEHIKKINQHKKMKTQY